DRRLHQLGVLHRIHVRLLDGVVDRDVAVDLAQRHAAVGAVRLLFRSGGLGACVWRFGFGRVAFDVGSVCRLGLLRRFNLLPRLRILHRRLAGVQGRQQQAGNGDGKQTTHADGSGKAGRAATGRTRTGLIMHAAPQPPLAGRGLQRRCSQLDGSMGWPLRRSSKYSAGCPWPPELPTLATASPRETRSPTSRSRASLWAYRLMWLLPWSMITIRP